MITNFWRIPEVSRYFTNYKNHSTFVASEPFKDVYSPVLQLVYKSFSSMAGASRAPRNSV